MKGYTIRPYVYEISVELYALLIFIIVYVLVSFFMGYLIQRWIKLLWKEIKNGV